MKKCFKIIILIGFLTITAFSSQNVNACEEVCTGGWYYGDCIGCEVADRWGNCLICGVYERLCAGWEWVDCCEPGDCGGCTPTCPAGYSTTVSGPLCRGNLSSCNGTDGCGDGCTLTGDYCYLPETNTTPSQPSSISTIIDGTTIPLSLNSNSPTPLPVPHNTQTVSMVIPIFDAPLTSRGRGYFYRVFKDPSIDPVFSSQTPEFDGDNNLTNSSQTRTVDLTNPTTILTEEATGKFAGAYFTVDQCNNTVKYSTPVEGYYVVDELPEPLPGPNPIPYIIDLGSDITTQGCQSSEFTGKEINNPLHLNIPVTDNDGGHEIEALVTWFSLESNTPVELPNMNGSNTGINTENFGIMIKENGNWSDPTIYTTDTSGNWYQTTNGVINNQTDDTLINVINTNISTNGNTVTFDFELEFRYQTSGDLITGSYNIYAGGIDDLMFLGTTVDQSHLSHIFDFGFDFIDPTIALETPVITSSNEFTQNWTSTDSESEILANIVNGYVNPSNRANNIFLDTIERTPQSTPDSSDIGLFNIYDTQSLELGGSDQDVEVNIGDNDQGNVEIYVTTYDQACNFDKSFEGVSLDPWIATKGGFFYSQEGTKGEAHDISGIEEITDTTFKHFDKLYTDQGTELLSARADAIYRLIHSANGAVTAVSMYDSNNQKTYWFDYLNQKFQEIKSQLTELPDASNYNGLGNICGEDEYCYYESEETIYLPATFICTGKIIYISQQDISINPNIVDGNENSGCIFIAKDNIEIRNGTRKTTTDMAYDYLEGFFIAENNIVVASGDSTYETEDGLEIQGGLVAFGRDSINSDAIEIQRNLKLYNTTHPTVVVNHHPKYSKYAEMLLGTESQIYKQEIGFKDF